MRFSLWVLFPLIVACVAGSQTKPATTTQSAPPIIKAAKASASEVADKFLGGAKIVELPEGKKVMSETIWPIRFRISFSTPVFNRYTTVFEGDFDTDVSGVKGYKRLVDIEGRNEAGATLTTRFMLVLYQDRTDEHWKVINFAKSQDPDQAVAYFRKRVDEEKENIGYNYYILGLSLIDAGKLTEARKTFQKSLAFGETEVPSKILSVPKDEVHDYLDAIRSIIGEND